MKTNLAQLIEEAFDECVTYGVGHVCDPRNRITVAADWAENEEDIEITILENGIVRFTYTEKGVA